MEALFKDEEITSSWYYVTKMSKKTDSLANGEERYFKMPILCHSSTVSLTTSNGCEREHSVYCHRGVHIV